MRISEEGSKGISEEGSKGISVDQVRDPWVIFEGDLGDIEGFLMRIL